MKKVINLLLVVVVLAGLLSSCNEYKETETGLLYKFHVKSDDTTSPKEGQFIEIDLSLKTTDSVLFNSNDIPVEDRSPIPMGRPMFKGDIFEGIAMMHVGDSASFAIVADSVWKLMYRRDTPPAGLEEAEYVYYEIKLNAVVTKEEMDQKMQARAQALQDEEAMNRMAYASANYPDAEPTPSGLYYIRTERGSGSLPEREQLVKVHYTGKFLDGTEFDSSKGKDPYEFALGTGSVIGGWHEGIALMRKGEKGILIIPSELAYGPRGRGGIPPFSTLVFDVELVDIRDAE